MNETTGDFKLFRNIFAAKCEKAVKPAFYRIKQKYERNFKNSKIKYSIDNDMAEFLLVNFESTNSFRILYQMNRPKVYVNIHYIGLDTPEDETFELSFTQLTPRTLCELLEKFITNCKTIGE